MAQTYKDLVVECSMYPHSNEAYDLFKECSELSVMERFLENQEFMQEQQEKITKENITLTESFFAESVDDATVQSIMEAKEAKKVSIITKIRNGFRKLWRNVINFFSKCAASLTDVGKQSNKVLESLRGIELTREDIETINKIQGDIWNDKADGQDNTVPYHGKYQPFRDQLKLKYAADAPKGNDLGLFEFYMCVVLSNELVKLNGSSGGSTDVCAIPIEDLIKVCQKMVKGKKKYHMDNVKDLILGASKNVQHSGLMIQANYDKIQKFVDKLKALEPEIEKMLQPAEAAESETPNAEDIAKMNEAYTTIVGCVGATISVYSRYLSYRKRMLNALEGYIKTKIGSGAKDGKKA